MVLELTPNNRECLDFQDCPAVICFEHFSAQAGTKAGLEAATLSFDIRRDPVVRYSCPRREDPQTQNIACNPRLGGHHCESASVSALISTPHEDVLDRRSPGPRRRRL